MFQNSPTPLEARTPLTGQPGLGHVPQRGHPGPPAKPTHQDSQPGGASERLRGHRATAESPGISCEEKGMCCDEVLVQGLPCLDTSAFMEEDTSTSPWEPGALRTGPGSQEGVTNHGGCEQTQLFPVFSDPNTAVGTRARGGIGERDVATWWWKRPNTARRSKRPLPPRAPADGAQLDVRSLQGAARPRPTHGQADGQPPETQKHSGPHWSHAQCFTQRQGPAGVPFISP